MSIRKVSSQTAINTSIAAAVSVPTNLITGTGTASIVISNVIITDVNFTTLDDTAIDTAGGYIRIVGSGFNTNTKVYVGGTLASTYSFQDSTELRVTLPATTAGTYSLMVFNDLVGAIWAAGITFSGFPTVLSSAVTSSSLTLSVQLLASGDAPLTFSLSPISTLPSGASLSSSGLLSGTISVAGVYSFIVLVDDAQMQTTQQTITLTVSLAEQYFKNVTLLLNGEGTNTANNSVFVDSSTNAFTVTRNGNVTQGSFTPFSPAGWSGHFDGTGDYLSFASNAAFGFGTGDFTWEAWVYFTSTGDRRIFDFGSNNLLYMGTNTLVYYTGAARITSSTISANTWYHVAVVRGSGTTKMYLNGTQTGSNYADTLSYATSTLRIGTDGTATQFMNGFISNARIVKGVAVFTGNFTVPTSALTATQSSGTNIAAITAGATSVLTLQNNRFIDNSSNAFVITVNGDAKTQSFSPFAPSTFYSSSTHGGSAYFDGTGDYLQIPYNDVFTIGTSNFTVEAWIYITAGSGAQREIIARHNQGVGLQWMLELLAGNTVNFYFNGTGGGEQITSDATVPVNQWVHVAGGISGVNKFICLNGVYKSAAYTTTPSTANGTIPVTIGSTVNPGLYFTGYISNPRIVKGTAVFSGNFTVPTAPVTTSGSASASSYPSTANVNTSFAAANTSVLTNFTSAGIFDASTKNNLETFGTVQVSTTQSKWGSSSISFPGALNSYVSTPSKPVLDFGTGDFTIECWVYFNSVATEQGLFGGSTTNAWELRFRTGGTGLSLGRLNTAFDSVFAWSPSANTWYHVAVTRSGTSVRGFINGTQIGVTSTNTNTYNSGTVFYVGITDTANSPMNGYIDDARITKGLARYTANFNPPTGAMELQ